MTIAISVGAGLVALAVVVIGVVTSVGGRDVSDGAESASDAATETAVVVERPTPTATPEPTPVAVEPALAPHVQAQVDYALAYW